MLKCPTYSGYSARQDPRAPNNLFILTGEEHANRRRLWNRGMSNQSLMDYEPVIAKRSQELVEFFRSSARFGSIDLNRAIGYFTFDFMGDMAYVSYRFCASEDGLILTLQRFGQSFSMLTSGDAEGRWNIVERFSM